MKALTLCAAIFLSFFCQAQEDTSRKKPADTVFMDSAIVVIDTVLVDSASMMEPPDAPSRKVYNIRPVIDVPIVVATTAFSMYGFKVIYDKPSSSQSEILALKASDINRFDRSAADNYSEKAAKNSDMLFYGSMPLPFVLFIDKKIRKDALKVLFLYWETFGVTGAYYTGLPMVFDRYRPLAYNPAVPMHERTSGNAKNSFLAGHVALVGTATFFTAKVYSDYNPDSKNKMGILYGGGCCNSGHRLFAL